jgi:hypothetical protein
LGPDADKGGAANFVEIQEHKQPDLLPAVLISLFNAVYAPLILDRLPPVVRLEHRDVSRILRSLRDMIVKRFSSDMFVRVVVSLGLLETDLMVEGKSDCRQTEIVVVVALAATDATKPALHSI